MKMFELVQWFQEEYSSKVRAMKLCDHHGQDYALNYEDPSIIKVSQLSGGLNVVEYTGNRPPKFEAIKVNVNPYHIESDVWTHTMMVCKQAENASYEVQLAALLHDIGKPATRAVNPKNGHVSFYNHDAVSAFIGLEILNREDLGLSKEQKIHIFNLIALHTQIYKLSVEQLATIGDMYLVENLIKLGNADHEGRFHSHEGASIPTITEVLTAKESPVCRDVDKTVTILCGLPGSGKSTWVEKNFAGTNENFQIVSRDNIINFWGKGKDYNEKWNNVDQKEVDKVLQEHFRNAIKYPTCNTIVDMTHMSKKSRRKSLSHFGPEYKKRCVVFLPDLKTLHLQNESRSGKVIERSVINRMMRSFYPPTLGEFDEIEYVI